MGAGLVLGRWELTEQLGSGAFGRVFAARDTLRVLRNAAVKVYERGIVDLREIQVLDELKHHNVVAYRDSGVAQTPELLGRPWLAMELADGNLTKAANAAGRVGGDSVDKLLQTAVSDALAGLAYLHRKGKVHRDIKPDNLLYGDGVWKVGDLGIARNVGYPGPAQGTVPYMAPELFVNSEGLSELIDIYALGATIHWILTSHHLRPASELLSIAKGDLKCHQGPPTIHPSLLSHSHWYRFVGACIAQRLTAEKLLALINPKEGHPSLVRSGVQCLATSRLVDGHLELWALDEQGQVWHQWNWQGVGWSDWYPFETPGRVTAIAAGHADDRHQEVFVMCADGTIRHRWCVLRGSDHNAQSQWSEWAERPNDGMFRATAFATSRLVDGHLELWALDEQGQVWHQWNWQGVGWSDWYPFETPGRVTAIAAGHADDRHQEVFVMCADGTIRHRWCVLRGSDHNAQSQWSEWAERLVSFVRHSN
jgi:hypothetical protein